jgi:hypothetical protein
LQGQFIGRERAYAPHYRRRVGFQANNRRHSESEIAESIRLDDGVLFESLRPAEPNATAGAVIPDPLTYVPGDPYPGYIRDSAGNIREPGELLNSEIELSQAGRLTYQRQSGPVDLGRVTPRGLEVATASALRRVEADVDSVQRSVLLALSETSKVRATFRDAGFYADPASGTVRIHAIEQTKERVSTSEIRLNAAEASIRLRATTSYVNEQIALAVIDPSQIAELTDIFLRLGAAEVDIDGLNATVTTLATATQLSLVEGRVTTAEEAIDALEGTISTKVSTTTFDLLADRVTNAETILTAFGDVATIVSAVSSSRLVQRQLDANTDADIRALLLGDRAKRDEVAAIAAARQELGARITATGEALSAFNLSLQSRIGAVQSDFAFEVITRASQFGSLSQAITSLTTSVSDDIGTLQAAIDDVAQSVVDEAGARSSAISTVNATLSGLAGDLSDETQARINAINSATDDLIGQIEAEALARGEGLTAEEQARIAALQAERSQTLSDIAAERDAREQAIQTVDARVEQVEQASVSRDGEIRAQLSREATAFRGTRGDLDRLIDKVLTGLLLSDQGARTTGQQLAFVHEEITALVTSEVSGVVSRVLGLALRIGETEGSIRELSRVVIDQNSALVQSVDTLRLDTTALVSGTRSTLEGTINTTRTDLLGTINTTRTDLEAADSNTIGRVDGLEGDLGNTIGRVDGLAGDLADEVTARQEGDAAEAQARSIAISAAITSERVLWQQGDSILAGIIDTVSTTVDGHSATLTVYGESIDGLEARGGLRFDVGGRVTGVGVTATATTSKFSALVDAFELVDPATGFKYLQATPSGVKLASVEVDTIKAGVVDAAKFTSAAMGEAAHAYNDGAVNTNGTNWVEVISIGLTSVHGRPIKLMFSALMKDIVDQNTKINVRIVRDDGTVIYGGTSGAELHIQDEGTPVCIPIIDSVDAGRATTWSFQFNKSTEPNVTVSAAFRFAQAEELSRVNLQSSSIVVGGGGGPGAGDPGGGFNPNPPGGNPLP